jgi:hypothetical protein
MAAARTISLRIENPPEVGRHFHDAARTVKLGNAPRPRNLQTAAPSFFARQANLEALSPVEEADRGRRLRSDPKIQQETGG